MAEIRVHQIDGTTVLIPASPAVSLVNILLSAGISIHHRCGGKAECGTCRVRLSSANQNIRFANAISPKEAQRLETMGAHPEDGERLACQTYISADCDVHLFS
ncbi:2Fe-2S iron-sulfur cluster-binding protein [Gracilinema caldarium]|uniref:2Fe-2S iron-sulfur cluster-binding protein n=1 Tax=Gracilinema caldarium TaxID=215591 RepID=UPI0002E7E02C|nr:2Fe-2S iron-sulfur cluster-binding protein [Gracilinema caldarium]